MNSTDNTAQTGGAAVLQQKKHTSKQLILLILAGLLVLIGLLFLFWRQQPANLIQNVSEPDQYGFRTCEYKGEERQFNLFIPESAGKDAPLLVVLHAYEAINVVAMPTVTGMNDAAEEHGYAVVYPKTLKDKNLVGATGGWNSGAKDTGNDDLGFLTALVRYLQKTYGFSTKNTFVAGYMNGGFMAYYLANNAPDVFRAVASVSGTMVTNDWNQRKETASVGVLQINGSKDEIVDLEVSTSFAPVIHDIIAYWVNANGLDTMEEKQLSPRTTAYCYSGADKEDYVWYVEIQDSCGGWPVESFSGIRASDVILSFFDQYRANK